MEADQYDPPPRQLSRLLPILVIRVAEDNQLRFELLKTTIRSNNFGHSGHTKFGWNAAPTLEKNCWAFPCVMAKVCLAQGLSGWIVQTRH